MEIDPIARHFNQDRSVGHTLAARFVRNLPGSRPCIPSPMSTPPKAGRQWIYVSGFTWGQARADTRASTEKGRSASIRPRLKYLGEVENQDSNPTFIGHSQSQFIAGRRCIPRRWKGRRGRHRVGEWVRYLSVANGRRLAARYRAPPSARTPAKVDANNSTIARTPFRTASDTSSFGP